MIISFKKFASLVGVGIALLGGSAFADALAILSKCSVVKGSVERLLCFDELTKSVGATSPSSPTASSTDWKTWQTMSEKSKIDDKIDAMVYLESEEDIQGPFGKKGPAALKIRCREETTDITFQFGGHFMSDNKDWGEVTLRADTQKAFTISALQSKDHHAVGLLGSDAIKLIRSLYGVDNLLVRATPYNESPITTNFHVAGLQAAIQPLAAACNWKK